MKIANSVNITIKQIINSIGDNLNFISPLQYIILFSLMFSFMRIINMRQMMQDKHFIIIHKDEDRDIFINKLNYPKTVYHVGNDPKPGDICVDKSIGNQSLLFRWIIEKYENLPEYIIFSQAIPDDHVHEPLLAIECTLSSGYGSFCFARAIHNQHSTNWVRLNPIREMAHKLGLGFTNDNNTSKNLFLLCPGEIFYVSRNKILEKPKSFYENLILWNTDEKFFELVENMELPHYLNKDINSFHPELRNFSLKQKIKKLTDKYAKKENGYSGWCYEALWMLIWADKDLFDILDTSQACIGNKLYFNASKDKYDPDFKFSIFPYSFDDFKTIMNLKMFENDWFDWNCPNYLKWRETLKEKMIWEGHQMGFDGEGLLNYFEQAGYKHISL